MFWFMHFLHFKFNQNSREWSLQPSNYLSCCKTSLYAWRNISTLCLWHFCETAGTCLSFLMRLVWIWLGQTLPYLVYSLWEGSRFFHLQLSWLCFYIHIHLPQEKKKHTKKARGEGASTLFWFVDIFPFWISTRLTGVFEKRSVVLPLKH